MDEDAMLCALRAAGVRLDRLQALFDWLDQYELQATVLEAVSGVRYQTAADPGRTGGGTQEGSGVPEVLLQVTTRTSAAAPAAAMPARAPIARRRAAEARAEDQVSAAPRETSGAPAADSAGTSTTTGTSEL